MEVVARAGCFALSSSPNFSRVSSVLSSAKAQHKGKGEVNPSNGDCAPSPGLASFKSIYEHALDDRA